MAEFLIANMAPIMFSALIVFLLIGYPVAFSLGACGLVFFFVGVELVEMAIDVFFAAEGLTPVSEARDGFLVKRAGPYALWCGDIFALPAAVTRGVAAVYDRASLVAFPPAEQPRFAEALARLTPVGVPMLLIGLEFDAAEMRGPPFPAPRARVRDMLGGAFAITELEAREVLAANPGLAKRGLSGLVETALKLERT